MTKPKDQPIRLPSDFEDTLGALLAVPPEKEKPQPKKATAPRKRPTRRRTS